jgi:uncharacterized membrane protein YphA (DoxX/SURF4 family)
MEKPQVVGLTPLWPWPLSRWRWLAAPVRAERLAILRIGLALMLLIDVLTTYVPNATLFYGADSFAGPGTWDWNRQITPLEHLPPHSLQEAQEDWQKSPDRWYWSLLYHQQDARVIYLAMAVWVVALVGLLLGFCTRINAVVVWTLSTSFANLNTNIDNAGDLVRGIILFYLMLCPCGAAWSVDAWLRGRKGPVFVSPWALRLLFVQMVYIYWCNGLHKITGDDWRSGNALYFVLGDLTLARFSYALSPLPTGASYTVTQILTWFVLTWELTLPLLLIWRPVRNVALVCGALFHLGILFHMELGLFPPYMWCLYLPLLPWERLADRLRAKAIPWSQRGEPAAPLLGAAGSPAVPSVK